MRSESNSFAHLEKQIAACDRCNRLREYCTEVAKLKRKSFLNENYWGKPVAGFGDQNASLWVIGLAPGAHGANRTGRVFTGDESGKFLYRALYRFGYANLPESQGPGDGLILQQVFISCMVRCAPPKNKPLPTEISNCSPYLLEEFHRLKNVQVILALGALAYQGATRLLNQNGFLIEGKNKFPPFKHGIELNCNSPSVNNSNKITLLTSYHVSQQNTFTGKLTESMFDNILERARFCTRPAEQETQTPRSL